MTNTITTTAPTNHKIERINPPDVAEIPGINHVVVTPPTATTVRISGQVALDEHGEFSTGDFADQVRLAASNLRRCLRAAGADVADLVRVRAYVVGLDPDRVAQFEETVLGEFPDWTGPTATLVGVEALFMPEALIEIDAEAAVTRG